MPVPDDASLTLGRRIGVLAVLAALGGAIVLAATSGGGGDRTSGVAVLPTTAAIATQVVMDGPEATYVPVVGAPTGEPSFVRPDDLLVNKRRIPLQVRVPDPGVAWDGLELRVLRGGTQVRTQAVSLDDLDPKRRVTLRNVPLKRGSNRLSVVFANAAGVGPPSETLTIRMDDRPPRLRVDAPRTGATVNRDTVTVEGRTVPGLRVVVRNMTTDQKEEVFANGAGRFEAELALKRGRNTLKVAVTDQAGNQDPQQIAIVRGNGKPEAHLSLSRARIRRSALPQAIDASVSVLDSDGEPIKGARVEFAFGPPGPPPERVKEKVTSKLGVATWSDIRVAEDATVGEGLVSVRVTLPDGRVLRDTVEFKVV